MTRGWGSLVEQLAHFELFSPLDRDRLVAVAANLQYARAEAGEWILSAGTRGGSLYLILSGSVEVVGYDRQRREIQLATLAAGSFFGEMSFVTGNPRSASVRAVGPTELGELTRAGLANALGDAAAVEAVLSLFAARRAADTEAILKSQGIVERRRGIRLICDLEGRIRVSTVAGSGPAWRAYPCRVRNLTEIGAGVEIEAEEGFLDGRMIGRQVVLETTLPEVVPFLRIPGELVWSSRFSRRFTWRLHCGLFSRDLSTNDMRLIRDYVRGP